MRSSKILGPAATLCALVVIASGCGVPQAPRAAFLPAALPASAPSAELGRAELWAAHCTRCHNLRPATEYSPSQWAVIVNHMRTVADLPGSDYRRLLEFLADRKPSTQGAVPKVVAGAEGGPAKGSKRLP